MERVLEIKKPEKGAEDELLPCPFCGSKEVAYERYEHDAGERWKVLCLECMATVDPGTAQQRGQAKRLWNRRT